MAFILDIIVFSLNLWESFRIFKKSKNPRVLKNWLNLHQYSLKL
tara:strand:+ start:1247 stop:1378 length:132 start_codon:yes stop_codon:yes gene_type:complete